MSSIEYKIPGGQPEDTYIISYLSLKEEYLRFVDMSDREFTDSIVEAAHFACICCWFKGIGPEASIGDRGIIHELLHYELGEGSISLVRLREEFNETLKLV